MPWRPSPDGTYDGSYQIRTSQTLKDDHPPLWETGRYEKKSDLAKKLGKSDSYISKAFSSLKLDDDILEDIEQNKKDIPLSVMDEISRVKDKTVQNDEVSENTDDSGKILPSDDKKVFCRSFQGNLR